MRRCVPRVPAPAGRPVACPWRARQAVGDRRQAMPSQAGFLFSAEKGRLFMQGAYSYRTRPE
ncbi:hypothetical protein DA2_3041 [Desulfovibrio sp. A2]|nr:hypothetical protein DA2_3041 [Desulfovibrio sp. A2]